MSRLYKCYKKQFILSDDLQFSGSLNENCQKWIKKFIDVLKAVCDGVCDGTVSVNDLKNILENVDNFRSVINQLNDVAINMENLESIIKMRRKEIEKYEEVLSNVTKFKQMCQTFQGMLHFFCDKAGIYTRTMSLSNYKGNYFILTRFIPFMTC